MEGVAGAPVPRELLTRRLQEAGDVSGSLSRGRGPWAAPALGHPLLPTPPRGAQALFSSLPGVAPTQGRECGSQCVGPQAPGSTHPCDHLHDHQCPTPSPQNLRWCQGFAGVGVDDHRGLSRGPRSPQGSSRGGRGRRDDRNTVEPPGLGNVERAPGAGRCGRETLGASEEPARLHPDLWSAVLQTATAQSPVPGAVGGRPCGRRKEGSGRVQPGAPLTQRAPRMCSGAQLPQHHVAGLSPCSGLCPPGAPPPLGMFWGPQGQGPGLRGDRPALSLGTVPTARAANSPAGATGAGPCGGGCPALRQFCSLCPAPEGCGWGTSVDPARP